MIHTLDLHHEGVRHAIAAHLLDAGNDVLALIDPGPGSTLPQLVNAVATAGFDLAAVEALFVSHVHLDHAGAAGALAARTGATVYAHPLAAPHLVDPTRLLASARRVYGARLEESWGHMVPVPVGRLRVLGDGEEIAIGRRRVRAIEARGHANHQHAYLLDDGHLFPGDAAAIRLPGQRTLMPATAPPEIDLEAWALTLDRLAAAAPQRLLLPHFGPFDDVADHLARLAAALPTWAQIVRTGLDLGEHDRALADRLEAYLRAELTAEGVAEETAERNVRAASPLMCVIGLRRALGHG